MKHIFMIQKFINNHISLSSHQFIELFDIYQMLMDMKFRQIVSYELDKYYFYNNYNYVRDISGIKR